MMTLTIFRMQLSLVFPIYTHKKHVSNAEVASDPSTGNVLQSGMMLRYNMCTEHTTAKLLRMYESEGQNKIIQLRAYEEQLRQIAGTEDYLTPKILLKAPNIKPMF